MDDIPEIVTQDRSNVHKIIEEMLENPDTHGIYPTTIAFNKLELLLNKVRLEAVGWTWAEACVQLDKGDDPRQYEQPLLIPRVMEDLNPSWKYNKSM